MPIDGEHYLIEIPNLSDMPYVSVPLILNNKIYYFEYIWNIRHEKAYLSIYMLVDNNKKYIVSNSCLTLFNNITRYVTDLENWSGELYLKPKSFSVFYDYKQDNIHLDYELSYIPS